MRGGRAPAIDMAPLRGLGPQLLWSLVFGAWCFTSTAAAPKRDSLISSQGADGHLHYLADAQGNRIPDFSSCGYAEGNRPIPDAPVRVVVAPLKGDSTARIQQAIDYVSALPLDTNGLRGAVL